MNQSNRQRMESALESLVRRSQSWRQTARHQLRRANCRRYSQDFQELAGQPPPDLPEQTSPKLRQTVMQRLSEIADERGTDLTFHRYCDVAVKMTSISADEIVQMVIRPRPL